MAKILYAVSPVGLGHATRSVAVATKLREAGHSVLFASGRASVPFLASYGFAVRDVVRAPVPRVRGGEMKGASLWYISYWRGYRATRKAMAELIAKEAPDLVVGDEEFSSVTLAMEKGVKHALVADELELGFARSRVSAAIESRVARWYKDLQRRVSWLIIPDDGEDTGNRRYVSPIVREVTCDRSRVAADFGLPVGRPMILFSMSGAGVGRDLLRATLGSFRQGSADSFLAVSGNPGRKAAGDGVFDLGMVRENQNLVAAADLVISTAGKSTIDEAVSAGTPLLPIPIGNHPEQERNAKPFGTTAADSERIGSLIAERIGRRSEPKNYQGARAASALISRIAGQ